MPTVSELIHSSFRLIGAIASGETLEASELSDAFLSLNQMISSWNTEGLSLVGRKQVQIGLQAGGNFYTLSERPLKIEAASVAAAGIDNPLELVDATGWEAIQEKGMSAVRTQKLFCDYLYPTSHVQVWPVPRFPGALLEMYYFATISAFTAVDEVVDLPPGYEIAVRYNFAIALLPEYPRSQADPTLPAQAQNYKASLVQLNAGNHYRSQNQAPQQAALQGATNNA